MDSGPGALPVIIGLAVIVLLVITRMRGQQVRVAAAAFGHQFSRAVRRASEQPGHLG